MKKITKLIAFLILVIGFNTSNAQTWNTAKEIKKGELTVYYYENAPYASSAKNGKLIGIEVDILDAFVKWAKEKKGVEIKLNYLKFNDFNHLSNEIAAAKINVVGLGSIAITPEREKYMKFSAPYLQNVSVLVSDGYITTARSDEGLVNLISELRPVTIKGSTHHKYLKELYQKAGKKPTFTFEKEVNRIPLKIKESEKYFGYIDIISFWKYVKTNENHFIKIHQMANVDDERFGFAFSNESDWNYAFDEFFESGFGFTTTKKYHEILEKYLGAEIINKVEIDF